MPYEYEYKPPFQRGTDPLTPMQRLNYHYTNRMGSYAPRPSPTPDIGPGAVRRGAGDIWTRVRTELSNIKQGFTTMGRGFAEAGRDVGRTTGITQFGQGAIEAGRDVGQALQRLNLGPQGPTRFTLNDPNARPDRPGPGTAAASPAPNAPTVETVERGAPRSTYDRGEGAPTGATRTQAAAATGTAPPPVGTNVPARNRYLQMYYAGADAQDKFLSGLPTGRAPIEAIRGTKRSYWSPTTEKEYGTKLEAAFGVEHKEVAAKAGAKSKQQFELTKERIKAQKPAEIHRVTDPETLKEELKIFDPNTKKFIDNDVERDKAIAEALRAGTVSEDEFKDYYNKASAAQKKRLRELIAGFQK